MFLTEIEHTVLCKYPPVRRSGSAGKRHGFTPHGERPSYCQHCGEPETSDNPLQICHRIPFLRGVKEGKMTPTFLNSPANLMWAHQRKCNKAVELPPEQWPKPLIAA
jgi:hypothetical protein